MRYYFDGDSNLYEYGAEDKPMTLPSKVRQMGAVEGKVKIYMEDYVYTYLYQYAGSNGGREKLAALVGRHMVVDGQDTVIICGAIRARYTEENNGSIQFTNATWEYIGSQMERYFRGLTLVGWVHCQPGFGSFLMSKDEGFHQTYFKERWQVLFVVDSLDKMDTFFIYNQEQNGMQQARGYFVYYEKNESMQEYMLDHSIRKPKTEDEAETEAAREQEEQGIGETTELERAMGKKEGATQGEQKGEEPRRNIAVIQTRQKKRRQPTQEERLDAAQEIRRVLQRREKEAEQAQKGRYTFLTTVSCFLCFICICMGIGLAGSLNRLQSLENHITNIENSYAVLAENMEGVKVQSAFAAKQQVLEAGEKDAEVQQEEKEETDKEEKNAEGRVYVVAEGDTLGQISTKYYGTVTCMDKIMDANGLQDPHTIICGQELRIP